MSDEIEIERTPGFINADGEEEVSYASANQAFHAYLNATGQKDIPKKDKNQMFKKWLAKAKDSGALDKAIAAGKGKAQQIIDKKRSELENKSASTNSPETNDTPAPKPAKIMGMPPMIALGVAVAAIGLISWGIYVVVKKNKKAS